MHITILIAYTSLLSRELEIDLLYRIKRYTYFRYSFI